MSDYLQHLVARVLSPGGAIRPRQLSIFEPVVAEEPAGEFLDTAAEADAMEIARAPSSPADPGGDDDDAAAGSERGEATAVLRAGSPHRSHPAAPAPHAAQPRHPSRPAEEDAPDVREAQASRVAVLGPRPAPRPQPRRIDVAPVPPIERPVRREEPAALASGREPAPTRVERVASPARLRAPAAVRELETSAAMPAGPTEVAPVRLPMAPAPLPDRASRPDGGRPAVQVTIGRVEVRARPGTAPARSQPASAAAAPKLEEYLQQRRGGSR